MLHYEPPPKLAHVDIVHNGRPCILPEYTAVSFSEQKFYNVQIGSIKLCVAHKVIVPIVRVVRRYVKTKPPEMARIY